jgi:hypothetical protein
MYFILVVEKNASLSLLNPTKIVTENAPFNKLSINKYFKKKCKRRRVGSRHGGGQSNSYLPPAA